MADTDKRPSFLYHVIAGAGWALGATLMGWGVMSLGKLGRSLKSDEKQDDEPSDEG